MFTGGVHEGIAGVAGDAAATVTLRPALEGPAAGDGTDAKPEPGGDGSTAADREGSRVAWRAAGAAAPGAGGGAFAAEAQGTGVLVPEAGTGPLHSPEPNACCAGRKGF
mmetsp:Transcript_12361/g.35076  ORF Transcript_12361/g.35076 Transcript_12361/m.35076 type:complete len:109 (+) Transcript_12361:665-991(+)